MTETIETKTIQKAPEPIQQDEEKVENVPKCPQSDGISKGLEYKIATKEQQKKRDEQERTKIKKKIFLDWWERSKGVISAVCEKVEINAKTFRRWKKDDPEFAKELEIVTKNRDDDVEDLLMGKVFIEKNLRAITYYLDRKHPGYKPKVVNEVVAGDITLEDLIDKDEDELNKNDENKKDKSVADGKPPVDKKQEGDESEVQIKHGAGVVLEKEDASKPDTESTTKGIE